MSLPAWWWKSRSPPKCRSSRPSLAPWKSRNRPIKLPPSLRRNPMSRLLSFVCGALLAAAPVLAPAWAQPANTPKFGSWGVDLTSLDKGVKPGDDFFLYVNGGWLKNAQIPADRSSTGSFQDLQILSEQRLQAIVDALGAEADGGSFAG